VSLAVLSQDGGSLSKRRVVDKAADRITKIPGLGAESPPVLRRVPRRAARGVNWSNVSRHVQSQLILSAALNLSTVNSVAYHGRDLGYPIPKSACALERAEAEVK
jgi:hypothetical protein